MTENRDFYVTGIEGQLDTGEPAIETATVAVSLEVLREQRQEDEAAVREFEELSGLTPQVYKLVPVGTVWEV